MTAHQCSSACADDPTCPRIIEWDRIDFVAVTDQSQPDPWFDTDLDELDEDHDLYGTLGQRPERYT